MPKKDGPACALCGEPLKRNDLVMPMFKVGAKGMEPLLVNVGCFQEQIAENLADEIETDGDDEFNGEDFDDLNRVFKKVFGK